MKNFKIDGTKLVAYCGDPETEAVRVPWGVTCIGPDAFSANECLKRVELPETVTEIAGYAFADCGALEKIILPPSVRTIGPHAFSKTYALQTIDLPENLAFLGKGAFDWSGLKQITIPGSVGLIQEGTFCYSDLEEVRIGEGVTVCEAAFVGCSRLTKLYVPDSLVRMFPTMDDELNNANDFVTDTFEFCRNLKVYASPAWTENNSQLLARIEETVKRANEESAIHQASSGTVVQPEKTLPEAFDEAVSKLDEDEAIIYGHDLLNEGNFIHVMLGFKKLGLNGFAQSKELYAALLYRLSCGQRKAEDFEFWQLTLNELDQAVGENGFLDRETDDENIGRLKQELVYWKAIANTQRNA